MLGILGALFLVVFRCCSPTSMLLVWAVFYPLFDHLEFLKVADLIPAITFNRIFIVCLLADYLRSGAKGKLYRMPAESRLKAAMVLFVAVSVLDRKGVV